MSVNKLFYGNLLFDIRDGNTISAKIIKGAGQTSVLFGFLGNSRDILIYNYDIKPSYFDYLLSEGLDFPGLIKPGEKVSNKPEGIAWGWNEESAKLLDDSGARCTYPDPDIVRIVNSKKFCHEISERNGFGPPASVFCVDTGKVKKHVENIKNRPYVIKPEHGNSGAGFIIKPGGNLSEKDTDRLKTYFATTGFGVIVQPWIEKKADISSQCFISPEGTITSISHHRTFINRSGTFFGGLFSDNDGYIEAHREKLDSMICSAGEALGGAGYFGPAGFDSFICGNDGKTIFLLEINARFTMGIAAQNIKTRLKRKAPFLFRFISKKRHRLPGSYKELFSMLEENRFKNGRGALLLTPLRVSCAGEDFRQPERSAFLVCGESTEDIEKTDFYLRTKCFR